MGRGNDGRNVKYPGLTHGVFQMAKIFDISLRTLDRRVIQPHGRETGLRYEIQYLPDHALVHGAVADAAFFADPRLRVLYLKLELERQDSLSPEERLKAQEELTKHSIDED